MLLAPHHFTWKGTISKLATPGRLKPWAIWKNARSSKQPSSKSKKKSCLMVERHEGVEESEIACWCLPAPSCGSHSCLGELRLAAVVAGWGRGSWWGAQQPDKQLAFHSSRTLFGHNKLISGPAWKRSGDPAGSRRRAHTHTGKRLFFQCAGTPSRRRGDWKVGRAEKCILGLVCERFAAAWPRNNSCEETAGGMRGGGGWLDAGRGCGGGWLKE